MTDDAAKTAPFNEGIDLCVVHTYEDEVSGRPSRPYDDDCELCENEFNQRTQKLNDLINANNEAVQDLARKGWNDPVLPLAVRVDMLVQFLMAGNGRMRQEFETVYHLQIADILRQVTENVNRARLTQGLQNGVPANVRPMRG